MFIAFSEHNCTTTECGFNLIVETHTASSGRCQWREFKAPVKDDDGEIADLIAVTNCPFCGVRLDNQLEANNA